MYYDIEMKEKFKNIIKEIKNHPSYEESDGSFPNSAILKRYPIKHLSIIVEQAENILKNESGSFYSCNDSELNEFIEKFIMEIRFFFTENKISINNHLLVGMGQLIIPSEALYNIASSREYPCKYKNIDLLSHPSAYDSFSVPFILRLAIENKIKGMIGYDYCENKNGVKANFPSTPIIKFLESSSLLSSPCPFNEVKKIYSWSCGFTHTARKEYIWLKLKALDCLQPLFDYETNKQYQPNPNSNDIHSPLNYLNGITLEILNIQLNEYSKKKIRGHIFYLNQE